MFIDNFLLIFFIDDDCDCTFFIYLSIDLVSNRSGATYLVTDVRQSGDLSTCSNLIIINYIFIIL